MRFQIFFCLLHEPNPFGSYRTPIDYQKRSGIIKPSPNMCLFLSFFFFFSFFLSKNNPRWITCVASVSVRRAFSALRILTAHKMVEAGANISTKMSMCGTGEDVFALVQVCTWKECALIINLCRAPGSYECSVCSNGQQRFVVCLTLWLKTDLVLLAKRIIGRR